MRLVVWFALAGCGATATGPTAVFDPSLGFWGRPYPDDARRDADGHTDASDFPNPLNLPLLQTYIDLTDAQPGWSNNAPIFVPFDGPLDTARLPDPEASIGADATVFLVDIDPDSPHRGERLPIGWQWDPTPTAYRPANTLAAAPLPGFPMRRTTTYALVVTTAVATPNPAFVEALGEPRYEDLLVTLDGLDLRAKDVAAAAVLTTGDPLHEMDRIARALVEELPASTLTQPVEELDRTLFFRVFTGAYDGPLFQHGQRPYAQEGGGFRFDAAGAPVVAGWESLRIGITTPKDLANPPADGFPVVIYAHGTGGDYLSIADGSGLSTAAQLAKNGIVGIGFDQPLHGTRATDDTDPSLHTFNYVNPEAALGNFRQGAVDGLYLAHLLSTQDVVFTSPSGAVIPLDRTRVMFLGHSQGGLTGALALPWMGATTDAAVLSAAGGLLSITLVERKEPFDIAAVFSDLLDLGPEEPFNEHHPVTALIQGIVEPTDPINYAPCWFAEDCGLYQAKPTPVLLTNGTLDALTPFRTAEALAASGRLPILSPAVTWPVSWDLRGLEEQDGPLAADAPSWDGGAVTAAFSQWEDGSHWVVFEETDAARMVANFLATAAEGDPTVER